MSNTHHLTNKLKSLKLGGMLDTLELRLKQVQQDNLGYIEFLEFLLEDELQRRANRRLQLRVVQAHFEEVKTMETFDFSFNSKTPTRQIMDLFDNALNSQYTISIPLIRPGRLPAGAYPLYSPFTQLPEAAEC